MFENVFLLHRLLGELNEVIDSTDCPRVGDPQIFPQSESMQLIVGTSCRVD